MQYILYNPAKYAVTFAVTHPVTAFSFVSYCFSLADTPLSAESKKANDAREWASVATEGDPTGNFLRFLSSFTNSSDCEIVIPAMGVLQPSLPFLASEQDKRLRHGQDTE